MTQREKRIVGIIQGMTSSELAQVTDLSCAVSSADAINAIMNTIINKNHKNNGNQENNRNRQTGN